MTAPLLSVRNLRVTFPTRQGVFEAVRGVGFDLGRERLGVVGESGSGKSMTGRAILGLIRPPGRVTADRMELTPAGGGDGGYLLVFNGQVKLVYQPRD